MPQKIAFKLDKDVVSNWLTPIPPKNHPVAGLVFWFKKGKTTLEADELVVKQLCDLDISTEIVDITNNGTVKLTGSVDEILVSASTGQASTLAPVNNPGNINKLFTSLEFYQSKPANPDGTIPAALDFIFFTKQSLEFLRDNFTSLYLSGAKSQFGSIVELPDADTYKPDDEQFILKLEGVGPLNDKSPLQGVALGIVCPPKWYTSG